MSAPHDHDAELDRIRQAYARRCDEGLASRYSYLQPDYLLAMQEQERALLRGLAEAGLTSFERLRVLDVGCGEGSLLLALLRYGFSPENLHGIDLLEDRVAQARRRLPPQVSLLAGSATALGYPDGHFNLVSQYTVFSSVLDERVAQRIAAEMWRVLAPGGSVVWFDFRYSNPRNPDVRGIPLREVRRLFPEAVCRARHTQLVPPIARRVAPLSVSLARALTLLPPLRSHIFATLTKPTEAAESKS